MKKNVMLLLALTLSLSFTACKQTPEKQSKGKRHVVNKTNNNEGKSNSVAIPMHGVKENSSSHSNASFSKQDSTNTK